MAKQSKSKPIPVDIARIHLDLMESFQRAVDREEKSAEQQVKFFISLVTGVIAVIAVLQKLEGFDTSQLFWIIQISLLILFLFGLLTLSRINWRSINSAKFSPLIRHSQESIRKLDPSFNLYLALWDDMVKNEATGGWLARRIQGSMGQFMILVQALIVSGFVLNLCIALSIFSLFGLIFSQCFGVSCYCHSLVTLVKACSGYYLQFTLTICCCQLTGRSRQKTAGR